MFMIYRTEAATSPLKEVWEQADEALQQDILRASAAVNQRLSNAPEEQGEGRAEGLRIVFEAPLGVLFEVDRPQRLVRIVRTWVYRTGNASDRGEG